MSPDTFDKISYPLARLYEQLSFELKKKLIERLMMHQEISGTIEWELKLLSEFGRFQKDLEEILRYFEAAELRELREVIIQAGEEVLKVTEPLYGRLPNKEALVSANMSYRLHSIYSNYYRQAASKLNLTNTTMLEAAGQAYKSILNKVALKVATGQTTRAQALKQAIQEFSKQGLPALVDRSGRHWSPEGYVNMVIRSTTSNTHREGIHARMDDWGEDLFYISAHRGARPLCEPYQGILCSWSGESGVTEDINGDKIRYISIYSTSYGEPAGIFGINCGHFPLPFIPGVSEKREPPSDEMKEENERVYRDSQRQRGIERRIRYWKSRLELASVADDQDGISYATRWLKRANADMVKFIESTGRTRRVDREQIYAVRAA